MRKPRQLVLKAVARGQHQHGHRRPHVVAQDVQHRVAVHAGQADVQDHGIEALFFHALQRGMAGVGHVRQETPRLQEGE
ncbi:hypothetical protein D3C72_2107320 [compost metagenome]